MRATLSILGLYNYDTSIFQNLVVPTGMTATDVAQQIIYNAAELELIYPTPEAMRFMIGLWSQKELPIWTRIYNAAQLEYNPIENYNRTETWSEETTAETEGSSGRTNDTEVTRKVAGFNGEGFTNQSNDFEENAENVNTSESGSGTLSRTGNVSGNIGVTTSQQMLEQELNIAGKLDVMQYIIDSFKRRFCLMVY